LSDRSTGTGRNRPPAREPAAPRSRRSAEAFGWGVPIGTLGGLIGLGGAEFRLPVLVERLGFSPRSAVPMNLVISLLTLAAALVLRARTLSLAAVEPYWLEIGALTLGGAFAAATAAKLLARWSDRRLRITLAVILAGLGVVLLLEAGLRHEGAAWIAPIPALRLVAGLLFGLAIGAVSALLGVAGGELLIPTLTLAFGADIRTAGTASLMISLVAVGSGLWRYGRLGMFPSRREMTKTALPMGAGSVVGAVIGGLLVGIAPAAALKVVLGLILIAAAVKLSRHADSGATASGR
jgi:uncharacterized membrane protein YfcA